MPRKGGKKKKDPQGASNRGPDEVQGTQSGSETASGVGPPAPAANQPPTSQPTQIGAQPLGGIARGQGRARPVEPRPSSSPSVPRGGTQAYGGSGHGGGPPRQNQQPGQSLQPSIPQQQSQAFQGQTVGASRGRGEVLGIGTGRGRGQTRGPPPPRAWSDTSPRPGPPQQQPPPQNVWAGQNAGGSGWPVPSQQSQQSARPIQTQTQPLPLAIPPLYQQTGAKKIESVGPSVWNQPCSQAAPVSQVPKTPDNPAKQAAGVQTVSKAMSKVSLQENQSTSQVPLSLDNQAKAPAGTLSIPQRKDLKKAGTLGQKICVLTNMMQIVFDSKKFKPNVVHYDVDISPDRPKYLMRHAFDEAKKHLFPNKFPAFDGKKNVYSAGPLPFGDTATTTVTVDNEDDRKKEFKVTFKKAADGDLDLSWLKDVGPGLQVTEGRQRCIQALDIILRMAPILIKATPVGRSFFTQPPPGSQIMSLGGGMDCWVGHFQSAVLGWKPFLNVDVAHKAFPKPQPVLELIKIVCGCNGQENANRPPPRGPTRGAPRGRGGRQGYERQAQNRGPTELTIDLIEQHKEKINQFLKGLKVVHQIPGEPRTRRTQRVNELVTCPRYNSFEHKGHKISVQQYYLLEKSYEIKYPDFPCLWVGGRDRNVHVPLELCSIIEGQVTQKKLDDKQTSAMIRHAATGTEDRKKKIMEAFNKMGYNNDPCMNEFGISVNGQFEQIPARILNPPSLTYRDGINACVSKGKWDVQGFLKPSSSITGDKSWTILNLNHFTQDGELHDFKNKLLQIAGELGVQIGGPFIPFTNVDNRGNLIQKLKDAFENLKKKMIKLVIVVIPDKDNRSYYSAKQASELKIGLLTQCLKSKTLVKIRDERSNATVINILLKINAKLNGINHKLAPVQRDGLPSCLKEPCMIVGADVTHPSPDAKDVPSIAAVVASHDPRALFGYNPEIRLQPPREEIILQLTEIMKIQLEFFHEKSGYWPRRIIFYRDGVGDGHFPQVLQRELMAIRAACKLVESKVDDGGNYQPKITFLVVQKRHHTRFFPTDAKDSDDAFKGRNVKAGTVVDTVITHPTDIDFYLCSHASIQGTARPTRYRVLWNDDDEMSQDDIEQLTYYLCHLYARCTRSVSYPTPTYYAHWAAFRARVLTQDVPIDLNNLDYEQRKLNLKDDIRKDFPMFFI